MNWKGKRELRSEPVSSLPAILVLSLFFLLGVLLGQVFSRYVPSDTGQELRQYLSDFVQLDSSRKQNAGVALSTLALYFRYGLLAFLLGFASIGVILLPCLTVAFGCFLSFSVCCFTATFGGDGILLALAVFGLRCIVTLPCYFLLSAASWRSAAVLARLSFGRGRRAVPAGGDSNRWRRAGAISLFLLAGACVDFMLSPWLLRLVLEQLPV